MRRSYVFTFLSLIFFLFLLILYNNALNIKLNVNNDKILVIKQGENITTILEQLQKEKTLESLSQTETFFIKLLYSKKIKYGNYQLVKGNTLGDLLEIISTGKEYLYRITVKEGETAKDFYTAVSKHPHIVRTLSFEEMAYLFGLNVEKIEGMFFPDTYLFKAQTKDVALYIQAFDKMQKELLSQWEMRAANLPYTTPYQALILASIIEKEAGKDEEKTRVASVFVNRLKKGMKLQSDPTVIYGMMKLYKGNLSKKNLRTPTPYNTYVIQALPPTPIALPGKNSIQAALHPAQWEDLYFVAKGNGSHYFSKTLKQHNCAVRVYQKKQPCSSLKNATKK